MFEQFEKVLNEYLDFKNTSASLNFKTIVNDIPKSIDIFLKENYQFNGLELLTEGSNGKGGFSDVPWVIVRAPSISHNAKHGFYLVYLFKKDMSGFYLSLNQGTENIKISDCEKFAKIISSSIKGDYFSSDIIDLASSGQRPTKYKKANIISKYYEKGNYNDDELKTDLINLLNIYKEIIINNNIESLSFDTFFKNIINNTAKPSDVIGVNVKTKELVEKMEKNVLYYGIPGCGKSYNVNKDINNQLKVNKNNIFRITFHPDYTYSDFIGQITPEVINGELKYIFVPGFFTRALKKAIKYKNNGEDTPVVLIIEEINRGNAPAIFGEIFQLLDRNDNGESEYPIKNHLIAKELEKNDNDDIVIPNNLYLIATMNTNDQNVFTLDTAFKRRWSMKYIKDKQSDPKMSNLKVPNLKLTEASMNDDVSWDHFHKIINNIIRKQLAGTYNSEDKEVGYFFVRTSEFETPSKFGEKLFQYLWFDVFNLSFTNIFNFSSYRDLIDTYSSKGLILFGNDQNSLFKENLNEYE